MRPAASHLRLTAYLRLAACRQRLTAYPTRLAAVFEPSSPFSVTHHALHLAPWRGVNSVRSMGDRIVITYIYIHLAGLHHMLASLFRIAYSDDYAARLVCYICFCPSKKSRRIRRAPIWANELLVSSFNSSCSFSRNSSLLYRSPNQ